VTGLGTPKLRHSAAPNSCCPGIRHHETEAFGQPSVIARLLCHTHSLTLAGSFSVMNAPHNGFDHDNVALSDPVEGDLTSPAISISPVTTDGQGRRVSATNHQHSILSSSDLHRNTEPAYASDIHHSPDHHPAFLHALDTPSVTVFDTDATNNFTTGSSTDSHVASGEKLVLASFGKQPWEKASATPGPHLVFAPRPACEPTGELIYENTQAFENFDNPTHIWPSSHRLPLASHSSLPNTSISVLTEASDDKLVDGSAQSVFPRSALKRKAESLDSPLVNGQASKKISPSDGIPRKSRTVSFERMSGLGPTSPDEGSTSSDLPTGQGRNDGTASRRRTRQSTASTPRPMPSGQTSQQSARTNRGTRAPSGHPPSILQPERVFPIQIGSELFRLSGASISSDGEMAPSSCAFSEYVLTVEAPSYFTQFFEQQLRENEESGNIRTLYIDRDPATFRDVARHLQGYSAASWVLDRLTTAGYHIKPRDGNHFVKLFADAQFYSCECSILTVHCLVRLIDESAQAHRSAVRVGDIHPDW
jgi:hypothetical protein